MKDGLAQSSPLKSLRFGIMCKGTTFELWQAHCLRELMALPGVEPALLIVDAQARKPKVRKSLWQRITNKQLVWNAYQRACVRGKLRSEEPVDLSRELVGVPRISCTVETRGKFSQYFSAEDVATMRSHRLDFILRFGFNIIKGDVLEAARLGVWSYHHDDLNKYRGKPASFWSLYHQDPVTGVTLQRLTAGIDAGIVLGQTHFATVLKSYSRSRDHVFFGSTDMPARVCRDLLAGHGQYVSAEPSKTTAPMAFTPSNGKMVVFLWRMLKNKLSDAMRWLFSHRQWCVGVVDAPIAAFLRPGFVPSVRWIRGIPGRRWIADPFGIRHAGVTTILAEDLDQGEQTGRIVAIKWPDGGEPTITPGVMPVEVHASYPYLVEDAGEIYAIPETGQAKAVWLYRAVNFPTQWERVATLLEDVAALDTSVFRHDGRWWMFFGVKNRAGAVELHAAYADDLRGPWLRHACNPLKTDIRGTRPGGTPFEHDGKLYRPAQDCVGGYGRAVVIQRVHALTPTAFAEEVAAVVRPDPNGPFPEGLHTLSSMGEHTLIDGQRKLFVPTLLWAQCRTFARKAMKR